MRGVSNPFSFLTSVLILALFLSGCSYVKMGKVKLDEGQPQFLRIGQTTRQEVLDRLGEPYGYVEEGERAVMSYYDMQEFTYALQIFLRYEKRKSLYLVFQGETLARVQLLKDGEGFGYQGGTNLQSLLGTP